MKSRILILIGSSYIFNSLSNFVSMSEALHQLIQSLDKTEKSYFKKFAYKSNYAKGNYYKLYDSIEKQEHYNEKKILKKNPHIKTAQQLSTAKNYLYRLILSSLCDYNKKKSIHSQLHQQLEQIEILCSKNLPYQAKKILTKAKKIAAKYDLFPYVMQLQKWDEEISRAFINWRDDFDYGKLGFEKEYYTIEEWKNYREHRQMANKFIRLQFKQEAFRITDEQQEIKQAIDGFLKKNENKELSNSAQSLRYYLLSYLAVMTDDRDARYQQEKAHLEFLEQQPDFRKIRSLRYLSILINLSANENSVELLKYLKLLEEFSPQTSQEARIRDTFLVHNWLLYYANKKNASLHLEEIYLLGQKAKKLLKFKDTIYCAKFVYLIMYNYFFAKDYRTALEWEEYYQQYKNEHSPKQYVLGIRLLTIFSNYELGDDFFVSYLGGSVYRYALKQGASYEIESTIVLSLKHIVELPQGSSRKEHFQKLKKKLTKMSSIIIKHGTLNFMEWVDEKIAEHTVQ